MANETTAVKRPILKLLKTKGILHITITTNGFGSSGWPDICFLYKGVFVGIECKFGKNKPSALQEQKLDYIKAQGGIAMLVNEENVRLIEVVLRLIEDAANIQCNKIEYINFHMANADLKLWRD